MKYTHIVWDFNGTILDDLAPCIEVLNIMLRKRGLKSCTEERYKEIFGFPIKRYYEAAGFDFTNESFGVMADEWAALYLRESANCVLCKGILEALNFFKAKGIPQIILSATEQNMLKAQLKALGIAGYFDETLSLDNFYAHSKVELGKSWIERVKPQRALFIGDTLHDYETANAMGIDCVLIASGHQSKSRLKEAGVPVFDTVSCLLKAIC